MGHILKEPPTRKSKGQHPGLSYEHPSQGYSKTLPATVTEANCGFVHEDPKRGPPENVAIGTVLGNEMANPIVSTVSIEAGKDTVCADFRAEPGVEFGLESEAEFEVGRFEFKPAPEPTGHPR